MKGILIRHDGWWSVEDPKDEEELKQMLNATALERPALRVGAEYYGCVCDADARAKLPDDTCDTVVMRIRKRFKDRLYGYVAGDVFIYLNKGLDDVDIDFISKRIFIHKDGITPFLLVEDFRNMMYEETDP